MAINLHSRAAARGVALEVAGCDISSTALKFATKQANEKGQNIHFFEANAIVDSLPVDYDVVMCSLFLHHLDRRDAIRLLISMAKATRRIVLVNDLQRSRFGYVMAYVGCRLLTRSPVVRTDGPLSVRAAFSLKEVTVMAEEAGMPDARFSQHWPQRFLLSWER